jgi:hypothetical protein
MVRNDTANSLPELSDLATIAVLLDRLARRMAHPDRLVDPRLAPALLEARRILEKAKTEARSGQVR